MQVSLCFITPRSIPSAPKIDVGGMTCSLHRTSLKFRPQSSNVNADIELMLALFSPADEQGAMGSMMQDLAFAIPGVDEAMGFAEIMK